MTDFKNFKLICSLNEILEHPNFLDRNNREIWNIKFNYSFLQKINQANFKTIYILTELPFEIDSEILYTQMHYICQAVSNITNCKHVIYDNLETSEGNKWLKCKKVPTIYNYLQHSNLTNTIIIGNGVDDWVFAQAIQCDYSDIRDFTGFKEE